MKDFPLGGEAPFSFFGFVEELGGFLNESVKAHVQSLTTECARIFDSGGLFQLVADAIKTTDVRLVAHYDGVGNSV